MNTFEEHLESEIFNTVADKVLEAIKLCYPLDKIVYYLPQKYTSPISIKYKKWFGMRQTLETWPVGSVSIYRRQYIPYQLADIMHKTQDQKIQMHIEWTWTNRDGKIDVPDKLYKLLHDLGFNCTNPNKTIRPVDFVLIKPFHEMVQKFVPSEYDKNIGNF